MTLFIFPFFLKKKLFLLHLFSLICVISSCLLSLLLVFLFSTLFLFFLLFFSFHVTSPSVCLSLCLFTLSLFYASSVYSFQKNHLHLFWFSFQFFSFVHPFLQNCFCSISFVVSHLFLICFFQSCSFEQEKLTFFSWQKKSYLISPRIFLKFCHFMFKKSFIVFRIFEIPLKQSVFCNFVQKNTQNGICNQQCLSRSHFLIIFLC